MSERGRPKKDEDEKLTEKVTVRMSKAEKERLETMAKESGMNISTYLRTLFDLLEAVKNR